jgi:hypothetical protein
MDEKIIDFFENNHFPEISPKDKNINIFDTGIHSMFENPFTEILASILNSDIPYGGRKRFIKYFILGLTEDEEDKKNISDSFLKELTAETQIITKNGKLIDMIISNNEYVITLENKIGHIPVNPFDDYKAEINSRYRSQKKLYYIFSLYECEEKKGWDNKLIGNIFSKIKTKLQFRYKNKWDYFVEDFLDHYIEERMQMTKKGFVWCEKNFSKLMEGRDWLEEFIEEIKGQLTKNLKPKAIRRQSWDGSIALRLKPFEKEVPDIVLCLDYDNKFSINIYYDDQCGKNEDQLKKIVGSKYPQTWSEGKNLTVFGMKKDYLFSNLKDAYDELKIQWDKMKKTYRQASAAVR